MVRSDEPNEGYQSHSFGREKEREIDPDLSHLQFSVLLCPDTREFGREGVSCVGETGKVKTFQRNDRGGVQDLQMYK